MLQKAAEPFAPFDKWPDGSSVDHLITFLIERFRYVLEQRGYDIRNVRAVARMEESPVDAKRKLEALPEFTASTDFRKLAVAFKRVKNIARELPDDLGTVTEMVEPPLAQTLKEPAEIAMLDEIDRRGPIIDSV